MLGSHWETLEEFWSRLGTKQKNPCCWCSSVRSTGCLQAGRPGLLDGQPGTLYQRNADCKCGRPSPCPVDRVHWHTHNCSISSLFCFSFFLGGAAPEPPRADEATWTPLGDTLGLPLQSAWFIKVAIFGIFGLSYKLRYILGEFIECFDLYFWVVLAFVCQYFCGKFK